MNSLCLCLNILVEFAGKTLCPVSLRVLKMTLQSLLQVLTFFLHFYSLFFLQALVHWLEQFVSSGKFQSPVAPSLAYSNRCAPGWMRCTQLCCKRKTPLLYYIVYWWDNRLTQPLSHHVSKQYEDRIQTVFLCRFSIIWITVMDRKEIWLPYALNHLLQLCGVWLLAFFK